MTMSALAYLVLVTQGTVKRCRVSLLCLCVLLRSPNLEALWDLWLQLGSALHRVALGNHGCCSARYHLKACCHQPIWHPFGLLELSSSCLKCLKAGLSNICIYIHIYIFLISSQFIAILSGRIICQCLSSVYFEILCM